jgi:hypothetical protein
LTSKKAELGNGKNLAGETSTGSKGLISEGPRTNPTQSKYQVSNDTLSAADLQPSAPSASSTQKLTDSGG